jgi:hypothetical protein
MEVEGRAGGSDSPPPLRLPSQPPLWWVMFPGGSLGTNAKVVSAPAAQAVAQGEKEQGRLAGDEQNA